MRIGKGSSGQPGLIVLQIRIQGSDLSNTTFFLIVVPCHKLVLVSTVLITYLITVAHSKWILIFHCIFPVWRRGGGQRLQRRTNIDASECGHD